MCASRRLPARTHTHCLQPRHLAQLPAPITACCLSSSRCSHQAGGRRLAADPYSNPSDPWYSAKVCKVAPSGPNTVANVTRDEFGRWGGAKGGVRLAAVG